MRMWNTGTESAYLRSAPSKLTEHKVVAPRSAPIRLASARRARSSLAPVSAAPIKMTSRRLV